MSTDETESAAVAQFLRLQLAADNSEGEVDDKVIVKEMSASEAIVVEGGDLRENNTTEEDLVAVV